MLQSDSPLAGQKELDTLVTVARSQKLFYILFIVPQRESAVFQTAFDKMLESIRFSS